MPPRPASIKVRALQWLAQREHSRIELRAKLLRLRRAARSGAQAESGDDAAPEVESEVDALLDWLTDRGHLSQERFVESRVHARQRRFGNLRIRQELQRHGARLDAVAAGALQESEFDRARQVWQRKYGAPAQDVAGRVRQMRFLTGRGFSPEVIRRVVRGHFDSDTDAPDAEGLDSG